jgi:hypothetical protein
MVMNVQVVFWVLMPCSDVVGCQHSRESCYLHLQGEVNGTVREDMDIRGYIQKFPDWIITKCTLTTINTH